MKKWVGKTVLSTGLAVAALGMVSGTAHAFDPQPDPPTEPKISEIQQTPSQPKPMLDSGRVRVSTSSGYVAAQHR